MSYVTILRGISGSGKSTYAAEHYPNALIVSADNFFKTPEGYKFDASKLSEAHGLCLRIFVEAVQQGQNVIVDNTNTTIGEIAPYYALAEAYKREVEIVTFDVPVAIAHERNVHNVPRDVIEQQHVRLSRVKLPARWKQRIIK